MKKARCIECALCDVRVDLDAGSNYYCRRDGETIATGVLLRQACRYFVPPRLWGLNPALRRPA